MCFLLFVPANLFLSVPAGLLLFLPLDPLSFFILALTVCFLCPPMYSFLLFGFCPIDGWWCLFQPVPCVWICALPLLFVPGDLQCVRVVSSCALIAIVCVLELATIGCATAITRWILAFGIGIGE